MTSYFYEICNCFTISIFVLLKHWENRPCYHENTFSFNHYVLFLGRIQKQHTHNFCYHCDDRMRFVMCVISWIFEISLWRKYWKQYSGSLSILWNRMNAIVLINIITVSLIAELPRSFPFVLYSYYYLLSAVLFHSSFRGSFDEYSKEVSADKTV